MRYAYFGFGMLLFGSIGLVIIVMLQSVTINNDSEYYNLKEAMQAAMLESIDYACYRVDGKTVSSAENNDCGYLLKISEQKFVDNFTRRFIATVGGDATKYKLEFYDIIESPPKASVVIKGNTTSYGIVSQNEELTITNSLSGILELKKGIIDKYSYFERVEVNMDTTSTNNSFDEVDDDRTSTEDIASGADDELCAQHPGDKNFGCVAESASDDETDEDADTISAEEEVANEENDTTVVEKNDETKTDE